MQSGFLSDLNQAAALYLPGVPTTISALEGFKYCEARDFIVAGVEAR